MTVLFYPYVMYAVDCVLSKLSMNRTEEEEEEEEEKCNRILFCVFLRYFSFQMSQRDCAKIVLIFILLQSSRICHLFVGRCQQMKKVVVLFWKKDKFFHEKKKLEFNFDLRKIYSKKRTFIY